MKGSPPLHRPARLRRLSDEDIALWSEVARSVKRRKGATLPIAAKPSHPEPTPAAAAAPATPAPAPTRPGGRPGPLPLAPIERRLKRELARGRGAIDAALDLHGMNQAEAHHALRGFLTRAQAEGVRLAIVVTGKGGAPRSSGPWIDERGILRRLVPHWLGEPDLRSVVLGFEEAGRAHGGAGALYVRLRRRERPR
jgi:DNA-nicking Smr family endonuclease